MHATAGLQWVDVGAARVAVIEAGEPSGPPAVLLPGLTDGLAPAWTDAVRRLAAAAPMRGHRGLVVSYRDPPVVGGDGGAPTTRLLADDAAAVLAGVLDHPALVVTHSMGGMVAQHLAADHPELVRGLVLSATAARADADLRRVLGRWERQLRSGRWRAFRRDAARRSYRGVGGLRRRLAVAAARAEPPPAAHVARHLALSRACATHDARDRLHAIRAPALVIAGGRDPVFPPCHAEELARGLPDARLAVVRRGAHGFPEQFAGPFHAAVQRFLDELGPEPGP